MAVTLGIEWNAGDYCLRGDTGDLQEAAKLVHQRVCRTHFSEPGFCVLRFGDQLDSRAFRERMLRLANELSLVQQHQTGEPLVHVTASSFDQQVSTKPHLDGGPEQSLLLLGYEPSEVQSELVMFDYAKCAFDMGITPKVFLERHSPMFQSGVALLQPYATRVACFDATRYQIVCINNSAAAYEASTGHWQGVLHQATVPSPDDGKSRIVNSTMLTSTVMADASALPRR
jgi:hypothetical protein